MFAMRPHGSRRASRADARVANYCAVVLSACAALSCTGSTAEPVFVPAAGNAGRLASVTAGRGGATSSDPCVNVGAPPAPGLAKDEDELRAELKQAISRQTNCAVMRKDLIFNDWLRCWSRNYASNQKLAGDPSHNPSTPPVTMDGGFEWFAVQGQFSAHTAAEALLKKQDVCLKLQMPKYTSAGVGHSGDIWVLVLATDTAHP